MPEAGTLVNTTTQYVNAYDGSNTPFSGVNTLSPGMKTFYDTIMLDNARDNLVLAQFGMKQPLPKNSGKTVEWRKWNTLPDADTLTDGVIPAGKKFGQTAITVPLVQMGLYVAISDQLETHHVDPVWLGATEEVGASIGRSHEKLIRAALQQGTNILYADKLNTTVAGYPVVGTTASRSELSTAADTFTLMSPDTVAQAVTLLQKANAPYVSGNEYVMVIHPSVWYDMRRNPDWIEVHKYMSAQEIYNGEVGTLHGVRFVKSTMCPIVIQGSSPGFAVYQSFLFAKDAFAIVEPDGASVETIIHRKESGIGGPLDQFGTVGGKFTGAAKILYPERMVIIESTSKYSTVDTAN